MLELIKIKSLSTETKEKLLPFGNHEIFQLLVDNVPVVRLHIDYHRRMQGAPLFSRAEIQYENLFAGANNSQYENKGYTKLALKMLTEKILMENNLAYIYLDINEGYKTSERVALASNYQKIGETYITLHPQAKELYAKAIEPIISRISYERYEQELNTFTEMVEQYYLNNSNKIKH